MDSLPVVILVVAVFSVFAIITVLRIAKFFRGIVQGSRSGMVFSDKIWNWKEGESLSVADLWPWTGAMVSLFKDQELPTITPNRVTEGTIDGVSFQAFRIHAGFDGAQLGPASMPTIFQIRLQFPKKFPGKLVVQHVHGPTLGPDHELESIDFNKQTLVRATSKKVPFSILSPDFMAWYLDAPEKPLLVFDGSHCYCTIIEASTVHVNAATLVKNLLHHIRHSGALE